MHFSTLSTRLYMSCQCRLKSTSSKAVNSLGQRRLRAQIGQTWNPTLRTLAQKNVPTLLYQARSHTPRTAARLFIGASCFVMAGHSASVFIDPPEGFSPLLQRFMAVVAIIVGGCGLIAVSRNILAVNAITAVPSQGVRRAGQSPILLKIETTRYPPWRDNVILALPRDVSLSQPIRNSGDISLQKLSHMSAGRIALILPFKLIASQFRHLWHALREIVFADESYMVIESHQIRFRMDEDPAYALERGVILNDLVKHTFA